MTVPPEELHITIEGVLSKVGSHRGAEVAQFSTLAMELKSATEFRVGMTAQIISISMSREMMSLMALHLYDCASIHITLRPNHVTDDDQNCSSDEPSR